MAFKFKAHVLIAQALLAAVAESAVMCDALNIIEILQRLRAVGVRLAIDDFGTGYSSLSHLKRLPVDELKIDKSFVLDLARGSEDKVIVKSTIDLSHNMGLRVVAEGVENQRSWDLLRAHRCDFAQGLVISKPLLSTEFVAWIEQVRVSPPAWGASVASALQRRVV